MSKPLTAQHSEWLSLVEVSGPFLTLPVLKRALPMGLDPTPLPLVDDLRVAWKEVGDDESLSPRWIRWVLSDLLELPDEVLEEGTAIGPAFSYTVPEHSVRLRPDFVVVDPDPVGDSAPARLLVSVLAPGTALDERLADSKWSADAVDRMAELCRGTRVRLGLVTNGDQWALVDAPVAGPTGVATWDANLWLEERTTLDAFTTLLGVRRFFSVAPEDTLDSMLAESANAEAEVTDQLGKQVRQAVELLVDAMSRANRDRGGRLFDELTAEEVYEAAVTVMMRLVFLLSAEERGLFLLGDETYDATYAVSTLRGQLEEEANTYGEEVIARRTDAWHRLLATFRMVYGGAQHENLRLPAYGGSLFDPDRFPILEGRKADESWRSSPSNPLPIDNRTVLHILGALQVLTFKDRRGVKEARRLSFRALDVEQIGHVYEGLLDHSAVRVDEVAVGLGGKKDPEIALVLLEAEAEHGRDHLVEYLAELTGLSAKAVEKGLDLEPDQVDLERLTSACDNDHDLADRIAPYLSLMRSDLAELPTVYLPASMYVTQSSDRRSSGTYYTPRVLAEEMVQYTLEPLVYSPGPGQGAEPASWRLKSSGDLLDLKICDMAMGSGAFLVASCRYLSARVLEAWDAEGLASGDPVMRAEGTSALLPHEQDEREILARRLVADSCIYGVDRNEMAVEMAKLSMWLITLAKDRPFTFVDHALRSGDSLVGISDLQQLECLHLDPTRGRQIHGGTLFDPTTRIEPIVRAALDKRIRLESFPVMDVHDSDRKQQLLAEANGLLGELGVLADTVVSAAMSSANQSTDAYDARLLSVAAEVQEALDPERTDADRQSILTDLSLRASYWLDEGRPPSTPSRRCFHWPLMFPEVFARTRSGFDAIVGNPPFLGGMRISAPFGSDYRAYIARNLAGVSTNRADLVGFFFLRAAQVSCGTVGLIATKTISEADTREASLDELARRGWTAYRAVSSRPWPGRAGVAVAQVWLSEEWLGQRWLDAESVPSISTRLRSGADRRPPETLRAQSGACALGLKTGGIGFVISADEALDLQNRYPAEAGAIWPFLSGDDLASRADLSPSRFVIDVGEGADESQVRALYPHLVEFLEPRVRPQREASGRSAMRDRWWQLERHPRRLLAAVADEQWVLVMPRVSKYLPLSRVQARAIPNEKVVVIFRDDWKSFGVYASGLHLHWALAYGAKLETRPVYDPGACFDTFVEPMACDRELEIIASNLHSHRSELLLRNRQGLTKTYNRVHDAEDKSPGIPELRELHVALDDAVRDSYGWSDLELDHGFHDTPQGRRFTLSASARSEVLDRLLDLNHQRSAEESSSGAPSERKARRGSPNQVSTGETQLRLGDE